MRFIEAILLYLLGLSFLDLVNLTVADKCMVKPAPLPYNSARGGRVHVLEVKAPLQFGLE